MRCPFSLYCQVLDTDYEEFTSQGIAAVFMLVPPQSSRRLARRTHATCVQSLGQLYTAIVSEWLSEEGYDNDLPSRSPGGAGKEGALDLGAREEPFSAASRQVGRAKMLALRGAPSLATLSAAESLTVTDRIHPQSSSTRRASSSSKRRSNRPCAATGPRRTTSAC